MSQTSDDYGTFRLLDDDRIEMLSDKHGNRVVHDIKLEDGVLTVGYTMYTQ